VAGVTPTAGGVVFTGSMNGDFMAFDSVTGKVLYTFNTGGAIAGGVSTYAINGKQYIAVASGNSSRTIWSTKGAATLIVFGLP
jgi:glucose dehydrogenase